MRLYKADHDLAQARLAHLRIRTQWVRMRTASLLLKRIDNTLYDDPMHPVLLKFITDATRRLAAPLPQPIKWEHMFPGTQRNIWEWNQENFGLALAWGLTHADCLKGETVPGETEWERQRRVNATAVAHSREWVRQRIRKRIEHEQENPQRRLDRHLMLSWGIPGVDVRAILREMGECLCHHAGAGTCDMCDQGARG